MTAETTLIEAAVARAEAWQGLRLDAVGVAAGLLDALALAVYYLLGDRLSRDNRLARLVLVPDLF